jgi:hypothetical protein
MHSDHNSLPVWPYKVIVICFHLTPSLASSFPGSSMELHPSHSKAVCMVSSVTYLFIPKATAFFKIQLHCLLLWKSSWLLKTELIILLFRPPLAYDELKNLKLLIISNCNILL